MSRAPHITPRPADYKTRRPDERRRRPGEDFVRALPLPRRRAPTRGH